MIELYAVKIIEPIAPILFQKLLQYVSPERRKKICGFYRWSDAQRSAVAELLLRSVLMYKAGLSNDEIVFGYSAQGKPFLGNHKNIHFNVSHAGDWVLCGVADSPIGVDVEEIEQIDLNDVHDVLSAEERKYLSLLSGTLQIERFYRIWTLKESYAKALGNGIPKSLDSLSINIRDMQNINITENGTIKERVYFRSDELDDLHTMAVCSFNERSIRPIREIALDEIINSFITEPAYA